MTWRMRVFIFLLVGVAMLSVPEPAIAMEGTPVSDDQVNEVARDMYCPVCENVPLDVCPTAACAQWRKLIHEKLSAGWTEGQIKEFFAEQYGWNVLALPPRTGLNWLIYVLPPSIVIGGVILVTFLLRTGRKASILFSEGFPMPENSTELRDKIKEDLDKR